MTKRAQDWLHQALRNLEQAEDSHAAGLTPQAYPEGIRFIRPGDEVCIPVDDAIRRWHSQVWCILTLESRWEAAA